MLKRPGLRRAYQPRSIRTAECLQRGGILLEQICLDILVDLGNTSYDRRVRPYCRCDRRRQRGGRCRQCRRRFGRQRCRGLGWRGRQRRCCRWHRCKGQRRRQRPGSCRRRRCKCERRQRDEPVAVTVCVSTTAGRPLGVLVTWLTSPGVAGGFGPPTSRSSRPGPIMPNDTADPIANSQITAAMAKPGQLSRSSRPLYLHPRRILASATPWSLPDPAVGRIRAGRKRGIGPRRLLERRTITAVGILRRSIYLRLPSRRRNRIAEPRHKYSSAGRDGRWRRHSRQRRQRQRSGAAFCTRSARRRQPSGRKRQCVGQRIGGRITGLRRLAMQRCRHSTISGDSSRKTESSIINGS